MEDVPVFCQVQTASVNFVQTHGTLQILNVGTHLILNFLRILVQKKNNF